MIVSFMGMTSLNTSTTIKPAVMISGTLTLRPKKPKATMSPEEFEKKIADKLARKVEKLAKKAAREERKRIYNENLARREKISKTK